MQRLAAMGCKVHTAPAEHDTFHMLSKGWGVCWRTTPHQRGVQANDVGVQIKLQPRSWVSALVAPREMVVEQSWRQEENGVYLVMSSSKDHPAVPVAEAPWYHWFSPVRAQVSCSPSCC